MNPFTAIKIFFHKCIKHPLDVLYIYKRKLWVLKIQIPNLSQSPPKWGYPKRVHAQWSKDVSNFNKTFNFWSYLFYSWRCFFGAASLFSAQRVFYNWLLRLIMMVFICQINIFFPKYFSSFDIIFLYFCNCRHILNR